MPDEAEVIPAFPGARKSTPRLGARQMAPQRLPDHSLRTLDALHLAIVEATGFEVVATADRIMANAAKALGVKVQGFFTAGPTS